MRVSAIILVLLVSLAACAKAPPPVILIAPPVAEQVGPTPWRDVALDEDRERIERIGNAWSEALAEAKRAGFGKQIAEEKELLDPDAGLPRALPPPGRYQCRVIKLGFAPVKRRGRSPGFTAYPPYFCYVEQEGDLTTLVKETGTERHAGRLWPDGDSRLVFLGALALGTEKPPAYGSDRGRDLAGVVERVAPFRWRLVIPWPRVETKLPVESRLDVLEMVPFTEPMAPAAP